MTTKNIMMVGGATLPALCRAASRRGLNIIAVCFPEAYERGVPDPATIHVEPVDFSRVIPTVRRLLELHKQLGFEGIVAVSEYGQLAAAMVARQLGMPGTPLHAVQNTRDKARMRRTLEEKGLGQVRFRACPDLGQAREFLASLDGPMIVKPVMGTGSDGVSRVTDAGQLAASWELAGGARSFGGVICEEYIDGPEVSIEAYLSGGQFIPVAITDKMIDERFLEIGHSQPTLLSPAVQETIFAATHDILRALDITDAVTHTEMRLSSRGPKLIETHTRMGGDYIHILTEETTGVDLGEIHVALALGEKPDARPGVSSKGAAVRFVSGKVGRVISIDLPAVDVAKGIHDARSYVKVGMVTSGRSASLDRFGHVLAVGASRAEADRIADQAVSECHFVVEEPELTVKAVA